jgi:hypothetical protein
MICGTIRLTEPLSLLSAGGSLIDAVSTAGRGEHNLVIGLHEYLVQRRLPPKFYCFVIAQIGFHMQNVSCMRNCGKEGLKCLEITLAFAAGFWLFIWSPAEAFPSSMIVTSLLAHAQYPAFKKYFGEPDNRKLSP